MAVVIENNKDSITIIAIRPFMHGGKTVQIGEEISLGKADGKHIISTGKAEEAGPASRERAKLAKADFEAREKARLAAAVPAAGAGGKGASVDIKALVAEVTKAVREELVKELQTEIQGLRAEMVEEVKKQLAPAGKK